jgi:hypothetical protein
MIHCENDYRVSMERHPSAQSICPALQAHTQIGTHTHAQIDADAC